MAETTCNISNASVKDIINITYPVGISIMCNHNPQTDWPWQTWTQDFKDRFPLGAGDAYKAGTTGGEASHTLSVNEMPRHEHDVNVRVQGYGGWDTYTSHSYGVMFQANDTVGYHGPNYTAHSAQVTADETTGNKGGSQPHNNMPPYQVKCFWTRTA